MPAAPYVPLRIFSCYTMLEGAIDPKAAAKQAKRLDFPAAALTDRNGLYGVMPFTDACLEEGAHLRSVRPRDRMLADDRNRRFVAAAGALRPLKGS